MDPRDRLRPAPDGIRCTACGADIPATGIRTIAERDGIGFVEAICPTCDALVIDLLTERPALTRADVDDMRDHLAGWRGDLLGLLDAS